MSLKEIIRECNKCGNLEKLTCDSTKKGKSNILVLGESPAKDGWIVTGRPFYNKEGKLQASGKILNKLLNLINIELEDINFTEVCKCIISDRKRLRECSNNCKSILFQQIEEFDCNIILTMGQYPSEVMLGFKIEKLSQVVGKKWNIVIKNRNYTVIPIYHPSPASPFSYKGNEPIFKGIIKEVLESDNIRCEQS